MMAVNRPRSNCTVTESRATTSAVPVPNVLRRSTARAAAVRVSGSAMVSVCCVMTPRVVGGGSLHIREDGRFDPELTRIPTLSRPGPENYQEPPPPPPPPPPENPPPPDPLLGAVIALETDVVPLLTMSSIADIDSTE